MPENDFEKKVQDKMDEFQLNPSAGLWNKVESRIRHGKKRRIIFWWPLALLLVGGGIGLAIWLTKNSSEKPSIPVAESKPVKTENNTTKEKDLTIVVPGKDSPVSNLDKEETSNVQKNDVITFKTKRIKNNFPQNSNVKPIRITERAEAEQAHLPANKKRDEDKKEISEKIIEPAEVKTKSSEPGKLNTEIAKAPIEEKKLTEPLKDTVSEKTAEVKPVTETKKIKIQQSKQWGIGVSAGGSALVNNFGIGGNRDYMAIPSATPAQLATYSRGGIKRSFSFSAQVFRKQRLSPRMDLVASLGYQYLSTRLLTGERVDSSRVINNYYSQNVTVNRFYRTYGFGSTNYTGQFHFMTLGAELSWRFTGQKANIRWNNGLSYERLLASSMLHYDGTLAGYYKDNSLLRKNHLFFNTSLSIPVGRKIELHPFASRSLTSVFNRKDSATSKFSNVGLRIRYLFDKRK